MKLSGTEKTKRDEYMNRLFMKSATTTVENLLIWAENNNVLEAWHALKVE